MRQVALAPRHRRIAAAVVAVLAAAGVAWVVVARVTGLPTDAAFRVGSTVVTADQLRQRMDVVGALYGIRAPADGPALDQFRRASAKSIAVAMVVDQVAAARKVVISDEEARKALDELVAQRGDPDGAEGFVRLLGSIGASETDVLDELKRQMRESRLYDQVTVTSPPVTDTDLHRYVDAHRATLVQTERRDIRNIVVADQDQAQQILDQAHQGADFGILAKQNSLDQKTSDSGGDLGPVAREQLENDYGDAAFAAPAGTFFGPLRTQAGWDVGQVLTVTPAQPLSYDEVAPRVRDRLTEQRRVSAWKGWLATQIQQAHIRYADDYRPPRPDDPPTPMAVGGGQRTAQVGAPR